MDFLIIFRSSLVLENNIIDNLRFLSVGVARYLSFMNAFLVVLVFSIRKHRCRIGKCIVSCDLEYFLKNCKVKRDVCSNN